MSKLSLVLLVAWLTCEAQVHADRQPVDCTEELPATPFIKELVDGTEDRFKKMYDGDYESLEPVSYIKWAHISAGVEASTYYVKVSVSKKDATKATAWWKIYYSSGKHQGADKSIKVLTGLKTNVEDSTELSLF